MRGLTVVLVMVVFSALALGQAGARGVPAYCPYGCGPFIPLVTTPSVTFETVSSSPVERATRRADCRRARVMLRCR